MRLSFTFIPGILPASLSPVLWLLYFLSFWGYSLVLVEKKIQHILEKGHRGRCFLEYTRMSLFYHILDWEFDLIVILGCKTFFLPGILKALFSYLPAFPYCWAALKSILILLLYVTLFWFFLKAFRIFFFLSHLKFSIDVPYSEVPPYSSCIILSGPFQPGSSWRNRGMFSCVISLKMNYFCFLLLLRWLCM